MSKVISECIYDIYEKNIKLLGICRNEGWTDFVFSLEAYIVSIDNFFDILSHYDDVHLDDAIQKLIQEIVSNESEITFKLESRISILSEKMKSLVSGGDFLKLYYH